AGNTPAFSSLPVISFSFRAFSHRHFFARPLRNNSSKVTLPRELSASSAQFPGRLGSPNAPFAFADPFSTDRSLFIDASALRQSCQHAGFMPYKANAGTQTSNLLSIKL
ncbi:MAG: hypothetical protein PVJ86_10810, partial [Phycisphaerales bacterium]